MRNIELDKRIGRVIDRKEIGLLKTQTGISLPIELSVSGRQISQNLQVPVQGHTFWAENEIVALLNDIGLPEDTPLSILGVELLPEPNGTFKDPVGANLGQVRILRTSALYPVDSLCCILSAA